VLSRSIRAGEARTFGCDASIDDDDIAAGFHEPKWSSRKPVEARRVRVWREQLAFCFSTASRSALSTPDSGKRRICVGRIFETPVILI